MYKKEVEGKKKEYNTLLVAQLFNILCIDVLMNAKSSGFSYKGEKRH